MRNRGSRYRKILICLLLISTWFPLEVKAQDPLKDLREIGNYVPFTFSTLDHFASGITLNGWTRVRIRFKDSGSSGWELRLFSLSDAFNYEGGSVDDIDLSELIIIPSIASTTDPTASINLLFSLEEGPLDPSNPNQVIADGVGGTDPAGDPEEIEIVFTFGLGPMMNKPEGFYFSSLALYLIEK